MNNVNLTLTLTYTQQYASLLPEVLCLPSAATTMMNFIFYHYFWYVYEGTLYIFKYYFLLADSSEIVYIAFLFNIFLLRFIHAIQWSYSPFTSLQIPSFLPRFPGFWLYKQCYCGLSYLQKYMRTLILGEYTGVEMLGCRVCDVPFYKRMINSFPKQLYWVHSHQ
jgi:hypothetical protein